ncbi:MAG: hypothetical protein SFY67_08315 [Candidatus Melainabacteria bacterium]|nr:hypothetical protein [Candidatus Melainabacteria bacterium]
MSELKNVASRLINGQESVANATMVFTQAAEQLRFQFLLDATNEASEKKILEAAHYISRNYDERSYTCLNTLIDLASEYLTVKDHIISFVSQIYDVAQHLDIEEICDDLRYEYWEAAEIVKPEDGKHLYAQELLDSFSAQIKVLEDGVKDDLEAICKMIINRYTKESLSEDEFE